MGGGHSRQLDVVRATLKDAAKAKPDVDRQGKFRFLKIGDDVPSRGGVILQRMRHYDRVEPELKKPSPAQQRKEANHLDSVCSSLGISDADADLLSAIYNVPADTYTDNASICLDAFFHLLDQTTRQYLGHALKRDWACLPPEVAYDYLEIIPPSSGGLKVGEILKKCVGYALRCNKFDMASALTLLLDQPTEQRKDKELLVDVIELLHVLCPRLLLPPQLVLRRSEVMTYRGDLHGAIRELTGLLEKDKHGESIWQYRSEDQELKVRAQCSQMTGQILHKMCCWKDAVTPLVESITAFGSTQEKDTDGIIVSLELISKCLCKITNGDYQDLKDILGFQFDDRYFQAHVASKEAADLARCPLFAARTQNQAAESLLMYTAQHPGSADHLYNIEQVITELTTGLAVHKSRWHLECRQEFFEFVRAIYLLKLAFCFSDREEDKRYATKLEETAMFLYGKYCQQLVSGGFMVCTLTLTPDIMTTANSLMVDLGLGVIDPTASCCIEITRKDVEKKSTNRRHLVTFGSSQGKGCDEYCSDAKRGERMADRLELGLPINPVEYGIPDSDVPIETFQDLCGCIFSKRGEYPEINHSRSMRVGGRKLDPELPPLVSTFIPTYVDTHERCSSDGSDSGVNSCDENSISDGAKFSPLLSAVPSFVGDFRHTRSGSVKRARLLKFNPVTGIWTSQNTLTWLGPVLDLPESKKGRCREAFDVQYLHQDEIMGRYVGKRYRKQRCPSQYLEDIICQKTARFLVTLFNASLHTYKSDIQVQYVPVAHLQIMSSSGELEDWINVEPYLEGDFIKLTNNLSYSNPRGRELATALTHFSFVQSRGKLMLVDLQGWMPADGKGVVYLTDPQFHSSGGGKLSSCDMGETGIEVFWETVHPECNDICWALNLPRPCEGSLI
ncbi:alpha-protein kinase 1-like [Haliotis rufescens]|uniref:alpha-protein kinase 1-like n=1 Tax=Haliotis rufescens TaxID=6454 RepID=UPI00201F06A6|nr:alpha-protein kinase 1-like [Haliotis rufescens]